MMLKQDTGQTCEGLGTLAKEVEFYPIGLCRQSLRLLLPVSEKKEGPSKSGLNYKDT